MTRFLDHPLGVAGRDYLAARGLLEVGTALRFGEVSSRPERDDHRKYAGRLVIPSFSARGTVMDIAFRCLQPHVCDETVLWVDDKGKDHYCPKYLFLPGVEKRLYNVAAVQTTESTIHIAEGQLDAATLVACGLPAVGVSGAQAWKPHFFRLFQGFDRICFWADTDDKGSSMMLAAKIRTSLSNLEVMHLPDGYDVNSFYVQHGPDAVRAIVADGYDGSTEDDSDLSEGEDPDEPEELPIVHRDETGAIIPF